MDNTAVIAHLKVFIRQRFRGNNDNFEKWLSRSTGGDQIMTANKAKKRLSVFSKSNKLDSKTAHLIFKDLISLSHINGDALIIINSVTYTIMSLRFSSVRLIRYSYTHHQQFEFNKEWLTQQEQHRKREEFFSHPHTRKEVLDYCKVHGFPSPQARKMKINRLEHKKHRLERELHDLNKKG